MENNSSFVIPGVSRKGSFVVFLQLLILLAIVTRPVNVNCLPTQETSYEIPDLEKTSHLGVLHDVRLDSLNPTTTTNILTSTFPRNVIKTAQSPDLTIQITSTNPTNSTMDKKQKREAEPHRTKVVGGNNANPNEFPFQVLFLNPEIHCGASILNANFILTAAHCFYYGVDRYVAEDYKSLTIVAGDHNREIDEGTEQRRGIGEVYIHEKYKPNSEVNDLAIVKLDRPLQLSKVVQPILLPDKHYTASGDAVVTGWGTLRYKGSNPLVLQKVTVPIVDMETCVKAYEDEQVYISIYKICAGDMVKGGVDACQGDSGGPLSVKLSNGSFVLVGVVSSGIECGRKEFPGIYMKISKYVDWINEILINFDDLCLKSYPGEMDEVVTLPHCGGLVALPGFPAYPSSFLLHYKSEQLFSDKEKCLWTLDEVADKVNYNLFVQVTLICLSNGNKGAGISVLNWNNTQDFTLYNHQLRYPGDTYKTSYWDWKLFLSYTSSGISGHGFVVKVELINRSSDLYGSNRNYETNLYSSSGLWTKSDNSRREHSSIVVNPQLPSTKLHVQFHTKKTKKKCYWYDTLVVYEIITTESPKILERYKRTRTTVPFRVPYCG